MTTTKALLLIDDDDALRENLCKQLEMTGEFTCAQATSGASGLEAARGVQELDCIILDVGLPDLDGREVCRMMRKADVKVPIVLLTGHDSDADAVLGLDSGANDYVTKPVAFPVLLARLRAHLRQFEQTEDATFKIGPYTFKPAQKLLLDDEKGGQKVRLTEKETDILKYLYRAGKAVGRDVLLHEVWGYNANVTTHTLETHIYRLRQKIERTPSEAALLVTESDGYRLNAT